MSTLEIIAVILGVAGLFLGWQKGLVRQAGNVLGIIMGITACRLFGQRFSEILAGHASAAAGDEGGFTVILAYVLLFGAVYFFAIILARTLKRIIHGIKLGFFDRLGGALFNAVQLVFALSFCLNLYYAVFNNTNDNPQKDGKDSGTQSELVNFAPWVIGMVEKLT